MTPLCQINCSELLVRLEALIDVAFLTLFVAANVLPVGDTTNGEGWVLRTYSAGQPLTLLQPPPSMQSSIKAFPIRWELIDQDYPCFEDALDVFNLNDHFHSQDSLSLFEDHRDLFPTRFCSKIGGWPSLIQSDLFNTLRYKPTYVFQIDSESKAHWSLGDTGIGYFGCVAEQDHTTWFLDWQQL